MIGTPVRSAKLYRTLTAAQLGLSIPSADSFVSETEVSQIGSSQGYRVPFSILKSCGPDVRAQVIAIMAELASSKVVLLKGAPATGKTMIMNALAEAFAMGIDEFQAVIAENVVRYPCREIPSRLRWHRKIAFHANMKYRDFVCGISTKASTAYQADGFDSDLGLRSPKAGVGVEFAFTQGPLSKAIEAAKLGAALLLIDEINRGSTAAIFGDAMVAIDVDKRADCNGNPLSSSFPITITDANGQQVEVFVPENLYIVAAMNEADLTVQPLDLALI